MPDASAILGYAAFWRFYVRLSEDPLENEVLRHFGATTINGREYAKNTISLPCGTESSLEVAITPDLCTVNLGLRNRNTDGIAEIGWWDDARWHPYALRWSELERVHRYWLSAPLPQIHPSAAFLLLAVFVGHGVDERDQFSARKSTIAKHYEQLRLFDDTEIVELVENTFRVPSEEDYNWSNDAQLGWVFGGEYPCYSIRNKEHSDGTEGRFPFSEWSRLMAELPE
jgi:hypothetical protein